MRRPFHHAAATSVMPQKPIKLAVLLSGSGTTLQNLLDQISAKRLNAEVSIVVGSKTGLGGIQRAQAAGLRNEVVERKSFSDSASFSRRVFELINSVDVDLVCMAGWLCLLELPERYRGRTINIHPSLLPSFGGKGLFGQKVHEAVLAHGCKVSGCTVHFVDGAYDTGPIILQRTCSVEETDTPAMLAHRVFEQEKIAYPQAIELFQQGRLKIDGRCVRITPG
jgi:phosphoribosylglycinamide formyltransferase-1